MHKSLIIIVLSLVSVSVFAQGNVGSPYSRYSIGEINYSPLIRNNAMGGLGYTIVSNNNVNFVNPAGIANIDTLTFIFDFGMNGGVRKYQSDDLSVLKQDYQISYVNFGFSCTKWWKTALGIVPYSNVGYKIAEQDTIIFGTKKTYNYQGVGGVTRVYWANAFRPFKKIDLKIGITAAYLFGEIIHQNSVIFKNTADVDAISDFYAQNTYRVSSFNFETGLQYDIKLKNGDKLLLGVATNFKNNLRSFKSGLEYTINTASGLVDTVNVYSDKKGEELKGTISIPLNIGGGIGYIFNDKVYVGVDYKFQDWSKTKFFDKTDSLHNAHFIFAGLEYIPAGYNGVAYKYYEVMRFRFGGYFNQTFYNLTGKEYPINDFGIVFGLGLPMKRSKTGFDISFKFGQRGTLENHLIRERYFVAGISFNLSDIWFVKSKFD